MNIETLKKTGLLFVLFLAAAVLGDNLFTAPKAEAQPNMEGIGRYQIAAWGSYAGERVHHSGYYVLDTVTGKVVDKGHSVHGIKGSGSPD